MKMPKETTKRGKAGKVEKKRGKKGKHTSPSGLLHACFHAFDTAMRVSPLGLHLCTRSLLGCCLLHGSDRARASKSGNENA